LRLLKEGKIDQPRLRGEGINQIGDQDSHWIDAETRKPIALSPTQIAAASNLEVDRVQYEEPLLGAIGMGAYWPSDSELTQRISKILTDSPTPTASMQR